MSRRAPLRPARLAVVAALAASACNAGTLAVDPPRTTGAVTAICARLGDRLPGTLAGHGSRVVSPRSPLTHAWGHPPIVLRCGVPTPAGFSPDSSQTAVVDGVTWFQQVSGRIVRWTAIRTEANVELSVPTHYPAQGGFLVALAPAIKAALP